MTSNWRLAVELRSSSSDCCEMNDRRTVFQFPEGSGNFSLFQTSRRAPLGPTRPAIERIWEDLILGWSDRTVKLRLRGAIGLFRLLLPFPWYNGVQRDSSLVCIDKWLERLDRPAYDLYLTSLSVLNSVTCNWLAIGHKEVERFACLFAGLREMHRWY